jgi:hypothetical protein
VKRLGTSYVVPLASAPSVGSAGNLYYNTGDGKLYKSNGSIWTEVGGAAGGAGFTISDTAPGGPSAGDTWFNSSTGKSYIYYDSSWIEIGGGSTGPKGEIGQSIVPYNRAGTLAVTTGQTRFRLPFDATIVGVSAAVGTAPTGSSIIIDVNKNGTTIFTTQGNRPAIAVSSHEAAEVTNMDITSLSTGDYITIDIDQIGSGTPGSDLSVFVRYQEL